MRASTFPELSSVRISQIAFGSLVVFVGLLAGACVHSTSDRSDSTESADTFVTVIKPLVESRCSWCHSQDHAAGGLNFQDRAGTLNSPRTFLVPGSPDKSLIYQALARPGEHPHVMPGDGWGITSAQLDTVRKWIMNGAHWPEGRSGQIHRKPYQVDLDDYL